MKYLLVMLGGGIGACLRYAASECAVLLCRFTAFPLGTLFVNTVGALAAGFLFRAFEAAAAPQGLRLFFLTGFLGGFTTFSTYSLDTVRFFLAGNIKQAFLNVLLNNALCFAFAALGLWAGGALLKR